MCILSYLPLRRTRKKKHEIKSRKPAHTHTQRHMNKQNARRSLSLRAVFSQPWRSGLPHKGARKDEDEQGKRIGNGNRKKDDKRFVKT